MLNIFNKYFWTIVVICSGGLIPSYAFAHEAYVVPTNFFWDHMSRGFSMRAVEALHNPHNVAVFLWVVSGVNFLLFLNFLFRCSRSGVWLEKQIIRLASIGPLFVRGALAISFFYSALTWSFLGPELSFRAVPYADVIRLILFSASILFAIGLFTEIVAGVSLIIFLAGFAVYGSYLGTYADYLGVLIVLLLFGMRTASCDRVVLGATSRFEYWKKYEPSIIRIFFGFALCYGAITVKFLHPDLTTFVVTHWNLTQFHWLFPSDPLLVTFGAGLAELVIGLFIVIGFELRLMVLISLFYLTLSLFFFRELVWPHLMLYGISLNLLVQSEIFTVDHILFDTSKIPLWVRPFLPHRNHGKGETGDK